MEKFWELSGRYKTNFQPDVEKGWKQLKMRIDEEKRHPQKEARLITRGRFLQWAAVLVALIGCFFVFKTYFFSGAEMQVIATKAGEIRELTLPDGSHVWLNSSSQIRFPKGFSGDTRQIELTGEGFFDVVKNAAQPFIVDARSIEVTVLGTAFNVRAYQSEKFFEVQVREGKVKMRPASSDKYLLLEAGERGEFYPAQRTLQKGRSISAGAWQSGNLIFVDTPLEEVIREIERFYEVKINLENKNIKTCPFTTNFEKASLEVVLKTFEKAFGCSVERSGTGEYFLKKGTCK